MQLEVGKIYEGKVTGITKFGAFVELSDGTVGMVHISEVSPTYVNDISEHLKEKQEVKVKVLNVGEDGKVSLSIKRAMPRPQNNRNFSDGEGKDGRQRPSGDRPRNNFNRNQKPQSNFRENQNKPASFEDMLSKFMSSSDEKFSDMKKPQEKRRGNNHNRRKDGRDFDY